MRRHMKILSIIVVTIAILGTGCGKKGPGSADVDESGKSTPAKPYEIRLTAEQVRILRGFRRKHPLPPKPPVVEFRN